MSNGTDVGDLGIVANKEGQAVSIEGKQGGKCVGGLFVFQGREPYDFLLFAAVQMDSRTGEASGRLLYIMGRKEGSVFMVVTYYENIW